MLVIAGPTGVGKTALAIETAERLQTDILSADSRQVFRGLDIGTAKPTPAERARVPHRWIDALDIGEPTSAGRFARVAQAHIAQCEADGRVAVVAGGSTLYVDAIVRGIAAMPDVPPSVQRDLERLAETEDGRNALFAELLAADPDAAATLDVTKTQRLVRLTGVLRVSGRGPSAFWAEQQTPTCDVRLVVLDRPREALYTRIEARVDAMLDAGLLAENQALLDAGFRLDTNPLRTIGYQEPIRYLQGEIGKDEMVRLLKQNTRRYAKRQLTWLRRYPEAVWTSADTGPDYVINLLQ